MVCSRTRPSTRLRMLPTAMMAAAPMTVRRESPAGAESVGAVWGSVIARRRGSHPGPLAQPLTFMVSLSNHARHDLYGPRAVRLRPSPSTGLRTDGVLLEPEGHGESG